MIEMYVILVAALLAAGAGIGIVAVVSLGIRREEADARRLTTGVTCRTVYAARLMTGDCGRIAAQRASTLPPGARRDAAARAVAR